MQTPNEDKQDGSIDLAKNDQMELSNDDLHETDTDRFAGSGRAGTAKRKNSRMNDDVY